MCGDDGAIGLVVGIVVGVAAASILWLAHLPDGSKQVLELAPECTKEIYGERWPDRGRFANDWVCLDSWYEAHRVDTKE